MTRIIPSSVFKTAMAAALGLSIALSPVSTAPARADSANTDAAIAALIALGIIGIAVGSQGQGNVTITTPGQGGGHGGHGGPHGGQAKVLPAECYKRFNTPKGSFNLFGKPCLRSNYRQWQRLPDRCEITVRVKNRNHQWVHRKAYRPACLRKAGYQMSRH